VRDITRAALLQARTVQAAWDAAVVACSLAMLRNCGKGSVHSTLNPELAPALYAHARREAVLLQAERQQAALGAGGDSAPPALLLFSSLPHLLHVHLLAPPAAGLVLQLLLCMAAPLFIDRDEQPDSSLCLLLLSQTAAWHHASRTQSSSNGAE
jgi:hypothetical protein